MVKGEYVLLTIPSKFWSVFSLIVFLSLSIPFLMSRWRSKFALSEEFGRQKSSLLWLFSSLFLLVLILEGERFSSHWSCSPISWFCLASSSMLAVSVWIYEANGVESYGVLDSIWMSEQNGTIVSNKGLNFIFPQTMPNWWCWDH